VPDLHQLLLCAAVLAGIENVIEACSQVPGRCASAPCATATPGDALLDDAVAEGAPPTTDIGPLPY
jgi:hypothetical protein